MRDTPSVFLTSAIFDLMTCFECLKIFLNMVTILMMSAKMATPGLFRIKVFFDKGFVSRKSQTKFYHVTQIML